jgi:hypoxanthine phosphoribosyltransferase
MQSQPKLVHITKQKVDSMVAKLASRISLDKNHFDYIVGIENGGLNVSIPLSKLLNVPHKSIKISFYNEENKANVTPIVDFHGHKFEKTDRVLVVDDLIDGGHTINYFNKTVQCKHKIAVLYWNKYGKYNITPDYFIEEKFINTWLEFYWEKE